MIEDLEYRPIPNYTSYKVNQYGQVLHNDKIVRSITSVGGRNKNKNSIRIKKDDGKYTNVPIAKLVALAFIGEPNMPSDIIKYKDGNSGNFSLSNIEWASRSEAYRELYDPKNRYCENRMYAFRKAVCKPIESYKVINNEIVIVKQYDSIREACNDLRVSSASICRCLKNPNGMSCGMHWRYASKDDE